MREHDLDLWTHRISRGLRDYSVKLATLVSYENSERLVEMRVGNGKISDQHIMDIVSDYACEIKSGQMEQISYCKAAGYDFVSSSVDIYSSSSEEIIFLSDGVSVSEQKEKRDKVAKSGKERTTINMMQLQRSLSEKNQYKTLLAADGVGVNDLVHSECLAAFGVERKELPIVAISDGARSIKNENKIIFGQQVTHFLDWYHIEAKVRQLMTQIAQNKTIKEEATNLIINYLWEGKLIPAVMVLKFLPPKNKEKQQELIGYLEKNDGYIINYKRRKEAGKIIGSGRIEKQNDIIVAKRQKRKAMSWSKKGALNLALVTTYSL